MISRSHDNPVSSTDWSRHATIARREQARAVAAACTALGRMLSRAVAHLGARGRELAGGPSGVGVHPRHTRGFL